MKYPLNMQRKKAVVLTALYDSMHPRLRSIWLIGGSRLNLTEHNG